MVQSIKKIKSNTFKFELFAINLLIGEDLQYLETVSNRQTPMQIVVNINQHFTRQVRQLPTKEGWHKSRFKNEI